MRVASYIAAVYEDIGNSITIPRTLTKVTRMSESVFYSVLFLLRSLSYYVLLNVVAVFERRIKGRTA